MDSTRKVTHTPKLTHIHSFDQYCVSSDKSAISPVLEGEGMSQGQGQGQGQNTQYVIVDIQPEYESWFRDSFSVSSFISWFSELCNGKDTGSSTILYLYNGQSLNMISESDLKRWLCDAYLKHVDGDEYDQFEQCVYSSSRIQFYDKGYAFFRTCLGQGIDEEVVVELVKYMISHNINDTRELKGEDWDRFVSSHDLDSAELRDVMEFSDECLYIPDLMDELRSSLNRSYPIVVTGGGVDECLKEVEIALKALDLDHYTLLDQFLY